MPDSLPPTKRPTRTVTVTVDAAVLDEAEALGIDLDRAMARALPQEILRARPEDEVRREAARTAEIWDEFYRRYGSAIDEFRDI